MDLDRSSIAKAEGQKISVARIEAAADRDWPQDRSVVSC